MRRGEGRGKILGVREDETMDAVAIYRLAGIYATAFPLAGTNHVSISGRCDVGIVIHV